MGWGKATPQRFGYIKRIYERDQSSQDAGEASVV